MVHHGACVDGVDEHVEVANGFAAAAVAAGHFDLLHGRGRLHVGKEIVGNDVGVGPAHAGAGLLGDGQAFEDRLFGLGAVAFEDAHSLLFAGGAKLSERVDAEFPL